MEGEHFQIIIRETLGNILKLNALSYRDDVISTHVV
jgi:hypothetical protein